MQTVRKHEDYPGVNWDWWGQHGDEQLSLALRVRSDLSERSAPAPEDRCYFLPRWAHQCSHLLRVRVQIPPKRLQQLLQSLRAPQEELVAATVGE